MGGPEDWRVTTHDWTRTVDVEHLADVRARATELAPTGLLHLVLEVLAYVADEAESAGRVGWCAVHLHADGTVTVVDDGRGTDTRVDEQGRPVRKPVMATRDVRFFDAVDPPLLADGHPRRGMSVVAALSDRLEHVNRRVDGAWTQLYEAGVPAADLVPVEPDGTRGTTVRFHPSAEVPEGRSLPDEAAWRTALGADPRLDLAVTLDP